MEIEETFNVKFPAHLIIEICKQIDEVAERSSREDPSHEISDLMTSFHVSQGPRSIRHASMEEWAADYRHKETDDASIDYDFGYLARLDLRYSRSPDRSRVSYTARSRAIIEGVLERFRAYAEANPAPIPEKPQRERPVIFIGHGQAGAWRDLRDHLVDKHEHRVVSYETGSRAGHSIRDILDSMRRESSFALLVMTADDDVSDGTKRARQNVVHEIGLFQGSLGFDKAIVLLENGVDEFSNLFGVQQIRFDKDRIRETFGDVLATIRREFDETWLQ